jgi:NADPH:quinone reductase-like Zn-dependent oxidoreductase
MELSFAAGPCETWCAALFNRSNQAKLAPKDLILIHAGASGVGTAAIQLARLLGAIPFVTCGCEKNFNTVWIGVQKLGCNEPKNGPPISVGLDFSSMLF